MPDDTAVATLAGARDFITADNRKYKKAGDLIKQWANDPTTVPQDTEAIRGALQSHGITVPGRITKIEVLHDTLDRLRIVCPPKEMIEEGEKWVIKKPQYDLPPEYELQVNDRTGRLTNVEFLLFRIGEYCVTQCM